MDLDKIREIEGYIRKVGSVNLDAEMEILMGIGQCGLEISRLRKGIRFTLAI